MLTTYHKSIEVLTKKYFSKKKMLKATYIFIEVGQLSHFTFSTYVARQCNVLAAKPLQQKAEI